MRGWWRPLVTLAACYAILVVFFLVRQSSLPGALLVSAIVVAFVGVVFFGLAGLGYARSLRLFLAALRESGVPVQVLRQEVLGQTGRFCEFRSIGGLAQVEVDERGILFWPPGAPLPLTYQGTPRMQGRLAAQRLKAGPPDRLAAPVPNGPSRATDPHRMRHGVPARDRR